MKLLKYLWLLVLLLMRGAVSVLIGLLVLQVFMMISRQQEFIWEWDLFGFLYLVFCFLALPIAYLYEVSDDLTFGKSVLLGGFAGMSYPSIFVLIAFAEGADWEKILAVFTLLGYGFFPGLVAGAIFWVTGWPIKERVRTEKDG